MVGGAVVRMQRPECGDTPVMPRSFEPRHVAAHPIKTRQHRHPLRAPTPKGGVGLPKLGEAREHPIKSAGDRGASASSLITHMHSDILGPTKL